MGSRYDVGSRRYNTEPQGVNLFSRSGFVTADAPAWSPSNLTRTDVDDVGHPEAAQFFQDVETLGNHIVGHVPAATVLKIGERYTWSVVVKPDGHDWCFLRTNCTAMGAPSRRTFFNLSTGALGTVPGDHENPRIVPFGRGAWRVQITFTPVVNSNPTERQLNIGVADVDNNNAYTGVIPNGIWLYHAQLEAGETASFPRVAVP